MTKFQAGTILTSQGMDYQEYAIGKAIRSLFTDRSRMLLKVDQCSKYALLHIFHT